MQLVKMQGASQNAAKGRIPQGAVAKAHVLDSSKDLQAFAALKQDANKHKLYDRLGSQTCFQWTSWKIAGKYLRTSM